MKSWFAWHPVKVGGEWIWLQPIYRRYDYIFNRYGDSDFPVMPVTGYWKYLRKL